MKYSLYLLLVLLCCTACRKEPTSWDVQAELPLIRGSLSLDDLLADSLLASTSTGTAVLTIDEALFEVRVDSILQLPQDTVVKSFGIAPIVQLTIPPGISFFNSTESLDLSGSGAFLSEAGIAQGQLLIEVSSTLQTPLLFEAALPGASLAGNPLNYQQSIAAGSPTDPVVFSDTVALDGYSLDLTGPLGTEYNSLELSFALSIPETEPAATVYFADEVSIKVTYQNLQVAFATGYFGSQSIEVEELTAFTALAELGEPLLDLESLTGSIRIENTFGIDLRMLFTELKASRAGEERSLIAPFIGGYVAISRALQSGGQLIPSQQVINLSSPPTSATELIEILPDSIRIAGTAELNPLGNISNFNDFLLENSSLKARLELEIPLRLAVDQLELRDTIALDFKEDANVQEAELQVVLENSFDANIEIEAVFTDATGAPLFALSDIRNSAVQSNFTSLGVEAADSSLSSFLLDAEHLELLRMASWVTLEAKIYTSDYPSITEFTSSDKLDFKFILRGTVSPEIK